MAWFCCVCSWYDVHDGGVDYSSWHDLVGVVDVCV